MLYGYFTEVAKFLSDGGNQFAERERQPENVAAGFDLDQFWKDTLGNTRPS